MWLDAQADYQSYYKCGNAFTVLENTIVNVNIIFYQEQSIGAKELHLKENKNI